MAERLVVLSDLWGARKGLWITSYLGYLQQYFDIVFYDTRNLADVDVTICTAENLRKAFDEGGMDMAVAHILRKEEVPSHYLTFCAGGTIAWEAGLRGLPMKSLYALSPIDLHKTREKPDCKVTLVYGQYDDDIPNLDWSEKTGAKMEIIPKYGHELYSDEKIIQKVCLALLNNVHKIQLQD